MEQQLCYAILYLFMTFNLICLPRSFPEDTREERLPLPNSLSYQDTITHTKEKAQER